MRIEKGDNVVMDVDGKKKLVSIYYSKKGRLKGYVNDRDCIDSSSRTDIDFRQDAVTVYANIGSTDAKGSAFGIKNEVFHTSFKLPYWGHVAIFRELTDKEIVRLRKTLKAMTSTLDKLGVLSMLNVSFNVYPPRGMYAGTYQYRGYDKFHVAKEDVINFFPKEWDTLPDLLWHEIGHALYYRATPGHIKAEWVNLFKESVSAMRVGDNRLKSMLKDLESSSKSEGEDFSLKGFKGQLEEDDAELLMEVLDHVYSYHNLKPLHLELLISNGVSIQSYWPTTLEMQSLSPIITEYATKSPEELFAETSAFYFTGQDLPKPIRKLWKKTLKAFVVGAPVVLDDDDDQETNDAEKEPSKKKKTSKSKAARDKARAKKKKKTSVKLR